MTSQDKIKIINLRTSGATPSEIASTTGISINTIKSFLKRHPVTTTSKYCEFCGKELDLTKGKKTKRFCNDKCRMSYWNNNLTKVKRHAYYTLWCKYCGKEFIVYGNKNRKYCCKECYYKSKKDI